MFVIYEITINYQVRSNLGQNTFPDSIMDSVIYELVEIELGSGDELIRTDISI